MKAALPAMRFPSPTCGRGGGERGEETALARHRRAPSASDRCAEYLRSVRGLLLPVLLLALAACSSQPQRMATSAPSSKPAAQRPPPRHSPYPPAQEDPGKRGDYVGGGLYAPHIKDSTPDHLPDTDAIPEPEVEALPRSRYGNRSPYQVLDRTYHVLDDPSGFVETGIASYYGEKFHGRRTSNQEVYDMYAFTAAHKSLPLPSFARVTNLDNGQSVVVRVNDRGPFHDGRVIDLSYAAAVKLGIHEAGLGRVEVRALTAQGAAPAPAAALHLQVGAFSVRANAEHALARLHEAGISRALLHAGESAGRPIWRLRIPVESKEVSALTRRVSRLGLGTPQLVSH